MDGPRTNRVLIIGGGGVLGGLAVRAFAEAGWEVRSDAPGTGLGQVEVDLDRPASVLDALREDELVINTVAHRALVAERLVLERGGTLINIGALPAAAARELRAVAGGARGTVLMNAGLAPGVTTIVAADLLRRHPEAEELEMVFTLSTAAPRGSASVDFVHSGLAAVARHRTAVVPLPKPFGERVCLGFREEDAGWLGGIAEGRLVRPYVCILEPAVHERLLAVNGAGAMTRLPRSLLSPAPVLAPTPVLTPVPGPGPGPVPGAALGRSPVPAPAGNPARSKEPVAHWIAAIRGDRRLSARTVRCYGDSTHTARSAVVFAEALLARPPGGGCFDPEEICALEDIRAALQGAGIRILAA
jgi:hypothetical protein